MNLIYIPAIYLIHHYKVWRYSWHDVRFSLCERLCVCKFVLLAEQEVQIEGLSIAQWYKYNNCNIATHLARGKE